MRKKEKEKLFADIGGALNEANEYVKKSLKEQSEKIETIYKSLLEFNKKNVDIINHNNKTFINAISKLNKRVAKLEQKHTNGR